MKPINTFRVVFFGETLDSCDPAAVRKKMKRILKIAPEEIRALLSGQNTIVKDGLDLVTAAGYRRALKKEGIITQVQAMVECPFCGHRQCVSQSCTRCGKQRDLASPALCFMKKVGENTDGDASAKEKAEEAKKVENPANMKAHGMLRIAIILLTSVVFLDSQLQNFITFDIRWLYLIPLPFFILGCLHLARLKGYADGWAILGSSTLFGLGVLLLLPDRKHSGKRDIKRTLFALTLLIIAFFWAGEKISTWYDLRSLSQTIASREEAWRSFGPDMANYHLMGLRSFMDQAFQTAEKHELRPREKYRIAEMCLDGLGRFLFGIQNCRFNADKKDGNAPDFDEKLLSLWKYDFNEYFRLKALELNDPYFLNCANNWHFIKDYHGNFFTGEDIQFIIDLHEYEDFLSKTVLNYEKTNGMLPEQREDLAHLSENDNFSDKAEIRFDSLGKLTLTIRSRAGDMKGETVQYGIYKGEKIPKDKKLVRIGGSLSERFRPDDSNYYVLKTMRDMEDYKSSDLLSQIKWILMSILSHY